MEDSSDFVAVTNNDLVRAPMLEKKHKDDMPDVMLIVMVILAIIVLLWLVGGWEEKLDVVKEKLVSLKELDLLKK